MRLPIRLPIRPGSPGAARPDRGRSRGQILIMFAGGMVFFIGIMAIVVDVSWYWSNTLRVQRAADAAALAGSVYLPGDVPSGTLYARAAAIADGYTNGSGGVTVTPSQDTTDPRQLNVTITAPVSTFFMRVFGITSIPASRTAKAIYVEPVPMGSPENYYGVYCLTTSSHPTCDGTNAVANATGVGTLATKNFWGAFQSTGDTRGEGDLFTPYNDFALAGTAGTNVNYSPLGYDYAVKVPANGGSVYIYDPTFCPVGGGLGSGDHYNADANRQYGDGAGKYWSVSSYYNLYDTKGTLFTTADDGAAVASSGTMFEQEFNVDDSGTYGTPSGPTVGTVSLDGKTAVSCKETGSGAVATEGRYYHDKWWRIATGLNAGTYRLNVKSATVGSVNWKAQAENDFGIEVTGPNDASGNSPRVYGLGKMAGYNILPSGTQNMYLAQIDQTAAGKTLQIDLFDPGDVSGGAWLRVMSPDGATYQAASFKWTADSNAVSGHTSSGGTVTCLQTNGGSTSGLTPPTGCPNATSGGSFFNNSRVTISIPMPSTYGATSYGGNPALTPTGETQPGWWKIEYTVGGGNDTTTWMVNIRGNPVHLVVP